MKLKTLTFTIPLVAVGLVAAAASPMFYPRETAEVSHALLREVPPPAPQGTPRKVLTEKEKAIEDRDQDQPGIMVDEPEIYDDVVLQQMLLDAEIKLASLQMFDEGSIKSRFGTVSGSTQDTSSFGLNIQGPSLPGIVNTQKGATGSVVQTDKSGVNTSGDPSSETSTVSNSGLPSTDTVTTRAAAAPPSVTAPAPSTTLPTNGSVASSKILAEQVQLTAQIQSLRLLLRGSLSGHFMKPGPLGTLRGPKLKTTIGIPITVNPDKRYKNAVAIVEVEVEKGLDISGAEFDCDAKGGAKLRCKIRSEVTVDCTRKAPGADNSFVCLTADSTPLACRLETAGKYRCSEGNGGEKPLVTVLIPQEKTYNVAAISDKSTSIGGGIATQLIGVSGSFLRGRKTFYMAQDQDTVAMSFGPEDKKRIGFLWQFRPVLGRQYVQSERKTVFVQLAFPTTFDAGVGEIGTLHVRSYWREYDSKKGVLGKIIPGSLSKDQTVWDIPNYKMKDSGPVEFNHTNLVNLGDGQMMVNLPGRFLPGTYVRIGNVVPPITNEYFQLRFVASIADIVTKGVVLVAPDGTEDKPLAIRHMMDTVTERPNPPIDTAAGKVKVETVDENSTRVTLELTNKNYLDDSPGLIFLVAGTVFNATYSQTEKDSAAAAINLSAVIPHALLIEEPKITVTSIFAPAKWATKVDVPGFDDFSKTERLVVLEQVSLNDKPHIKFLLYGNRLVNINVLSGASITSLVASEDATIRVVTMPLSLVQANRFLVLQRGSERPFAVTIPPVDIKEKLPEPKPTKLLLVNENEAIIDGIKAAEIAKILWNDGEVAFGLTKDDGKVRLINLRGTRLTELAETKTLTFVLRSGSRVSLKLEVVSGRVETISK